MAVPTPNVSTPRRSAHPGFASGARVWLVRHGEVREDFQGLAYGGMDVPLSKQGRADSEQLAKRLRDVPFKAVIGSNLQRARELATLISTATSAPLEIHRELAEIDRGRWQGTPTKQLLAEREREIAAFYADPWNWREHGGETDSDVESAVKRFGGPIAIVCHYNVVRNLIANALGIEPTAAFRVRIDLTSFAVLRDGPRGWVLERCNVRSPRGALA
jgi:alpha-ribazole phosphatase